MRSVPIEHVCRTDVILIRGATCPACDIDPASEPIAIAEDQPEYETLYALALLPEGASRLGYDPASRPLVTRWEFTDAEREAIHEGAPLDILILNFGGPVQPLAPSVRGVSE